MQINFISFDVCFVMNNFNISQNTQSSYIVSRQQKIFDFLKKNVFQIIDRKEIFDDAKIFNFRFVDEIKNSKTKKTFEKSKLIVQTYNNNEKDFVLTQSFTIQ